MAECTCGHQGDAAEHEQDCPVFRQWQRGRSVSATRRFVMRGGELVEVTLTPTMETR